MEKQTAHDDRYDIADEYMTARAPHRPRRRRCSLASGGGSSDSSSTTAAALSSCDINGHQQDLGASYVTSIQVAGVRCGQAEKVVVAYHRCRLQTGGAGGTCSTAVRGFEDFGSAPVRARCPVQRHGRLPQGRGGDQEHLHAEFLG